MKYFIEQLKKRLSGLSWHTAMMIVPFLSGFLMSQDVRDLVDKYPEQLGFLIGAGLVLAQISKWINVYLTFRQELKDLENNQ